jgi:hypothetical protein
MLTDPSLAKLFPDLSVFKPLFKNHYKQFTKDRIIQLEKMREREDETRVYIYEEDLQFLPK